ncbi:MAG: hypothetical protein UT55_C0030G0004 [Candidatus Peregrinibacteria bacterium GW2011_GWE2_39_6]|nr:MAG: hypothetical protein UT36_C0009G0022 [Candidatus Peregrinibacteria bacterium GW2011_GWF2_39_17]KKR25770.1 MAG: hypothetical protein UT55_C0030G0004 [Candidatus Peregrinibacteria bacterium GW2011_GWE2_39_6]HCW32734.1 hypothetical protein [Candidatus Peregrinibacteria bacterium]
MMNLLKVLIIEGRIPHLMGLKRICFWVGISLPFLIFLRPLEWRDFGEWGWQILVGVMLIRPLADIFTEIKLLRSLVLLRREFGIFSALMLLGHFWGFSAAQNLSVFKVAGDGQYWNFNTYLAWGLLGLSFSLPVLLTSNKFSMILLKRGWKWVQKLSYLFFLCGGIHVTLMGRGGVVPIVIVAVLWILAEAHFKVEFLKFFRVSKSSL